jgi:hypothetical protein
VKFDLTYLKSIGREEFKHQCLKQEEQLTKAPEPQNRSILRRGKRHFKAGNRCVEGL